MSLKALRRPRRLVPGDRVAIVTPASPLPEDRLAAGLEVLRGWGLDPVVMPHAEDGPGTFAYLAGTDADRAADFQAAWADPSIAAVFSARGGYGAQRMLDLIDWAGLREAEPKAFIGFSDVTAIHESIAVHLGTATIHGPMPSWSVFIAAEAGAETREHLRQTLFEPERVQKLAPPSARPLVGGKASGITAGGNLSLLAAGIGTAEHRDDLEGAVLLLEETDERPYRIDRMLTQLGRAGWFDGIAGIVLGSWVDCGPYEAVRNVLADRLGRLGVPIVEEFGFGHCVPSMTVPLGVKASLDSDAGTLTFGLPALS